MKFVKTLTIFSILMMGACDYPVPLSTDHTIPIDESLLGVWQQIDEEGTSENAVFVTILRFSDTEYFAEFTSDDTTIYFRGYLVEVGGRVVLQVEFLGDGNGPPSKNDTRLYSVLSIKVENDNLTFSNLSPKLMPECISNSKVLRDAFTREIDNPQLFINPEWYKKVRHQTK